MEYNIVILPGDGIGPEIVKEAEKILQICASAYSTTLNLKKYCAGGASIDKYGTPLTDKAFEACKKSDAILLGNIGGDKWNGLPIEKRPERVLFRLRGELGLSVNIRPIFIKPSLIRQSVLKKERLIHGIDTVFIRDVTGGELPSEKYQGVGKFGKEAFDKDYYNEKIILEAANWAFKIASQRSKKLLSADKANGLVSSALWRSVFNEKSKEFPSVKFESKLIDDTARDLVSNASDFDVVVAPNLFGDIISDELTGIVGSKGILPAATLSNSGKGMYEPNQLHNTDISIVNKNIANPIGIILSTALMFRYSLNMNDAAKKIEKSVDIVLNNGFATKDIYEEGKKLVSTIEMGDLISIELKKLLGENK